MYKKTDFKVYFFCFLLAFVAGSWSRWFAWATPVLMPSSWPMVRFMTVVFTKVLSGWPRAPPPLTLEAADADGPDAVDGAAASPASAFLMRSTCARTRSSSDRIG